MCLLSTPAQRSLSEVHVMFCECYLFFYFFNGRLMLRPWLTEVHETCRAYTWWTLRSYLDFFLVLLQLQGGPKMTKFDIFSDPARKRSARTLQNIVILKKNLLSTDGCSTRVPGLMNFGLQTPEIHASYYCS